MGDIIELKRPFPIGVWICNCGCCTFYLFSDGVIQCAMCKAIQSCESGLYDPSGAPATHVRERYL